MKKRITLVLLVLVFVTSLVFAAGATEDSGEKQKKIELSFWAEFITPERTEYVERMAEEYEKLNPHVSIEVTPLPDKADKKILTAYEAGQGPDIFLSSGPDITSQSNGEYIIPLNSYFDSWTEKDRILPSAIQTVRDLDISGEGNLYYIPNGISVTVIWVRSDWLKDTGMSSIATWNDFFSAAEKMTNKSEKQYGVAIRGGAGGAKFLERQMYAYSGLLSVFDENGKCTLNDPKHVEFVERYFGMYKENTSEGDLNYGWTELSAAFDSGHAGMIIHNLGSAANHVKAFNNDLTKFAAIGMPLNDSGTSVNLMLQPGGLTISSTCEYPEEAFNFIKFMTTGDAVSEYAQKWGVIPVDTKVLQSASWIQETPWFKASADLLLNPNTLFYNQYAWLPGRNALYNQVDTDSQYVMTGQMTAKEMLDRWAESAQESYDKVMGK